MKKLSGLLAVSLIAIMMAPAARADIASTGFVTKELGAKEDVAKKVTNASGYTDDITSTDKYPSMAVANDMVKQAVKSVNDAKLDETFENSPNEVMVTDAEGVVGPSEIKTNGTGNAVTGIEVKNGAYTLNKGTTFATKAQLDTTNTNVTNLTTRVTTAEGTINTQGTDIAKLKTGKQDNLTAGTGIKIDKTTNTISTDGLATDADLTTLQETVAGHTTSIDKLDGADTVTGSVKQQIKAAKSELTTSIEANTTAAANAKSAADTAQATADGLKKSKQDKLVATGENANIAGSDGVSVSIGTDGKITVKGNQAAIDTALAGKQASLSTTQMAAVNSGITSAKVTSYDGAVTKANAALPKATYNSQVGTVSSANMGTIATTVVGAIKEIKDAVSTADGAAVKADQGTTNKDKAVITDANGKVTTGQIATGMIADNAVTTAKIAAKNVTTAKIADGAVGATQLGANAVTSAKIADGTIVNADISASAAIAQSKIAGLTDALAAKFVAPGTSATSTDGTYTLTMKVVNNQPTYAWEQIGR